MAGGWPDFPWLFKVSRMPMVAASDSSKDTWWWVKATQNTRHKLLRAVWYVAKCRLTMFKYLTLLHDASWCLMSGCYIMFFYQYYLLVCGPCCYRISMTHAIYEPICLSIIALIYKHIQYQIYHQYDARIKIAQHTVMTHVVSTSFWLFAGFSGWKADRSDRLVSSEWKSLKVLLVFPTFEWKLGKAAGVFISVPIDEWDQ